MFYDLIFPQYLKGKGVSVLILIIRLFFGILFLMHGLDKITNFNELEPTYPNVFGFGGYLTLLLAIFCEFACSLFLIAGLLVRIVTIPMMISMAVAFFDIHDAMMPQGELSLIYLCMFIFLFFTGSGRYSVDNMIDQKVRKEVKDPEFSEA